VGSSFLPRRRKLPVECLKKFVARLLERYVGCDANNLTSSFLIIPGVDIPSAREGKISREIRPY
jgi:hypothetical protein